MATLREGRWGRLVLSIDVGAQTEVPEILGLKSPSLSCPTTEERAT